MDVLVRKLIVDEANDFSADIDTFQRDYGSRTLFPELNDDNLREKLWETLFKYISSNSNASLKYKCLSALRILSRDKTDLEKIITNDRLNLALEAAHLTNKHTESSVFNNVTIEALKLLCNLLFQSTNVQQQILQSTCLECLLERMNNYPENIPYEVKLFDTRIVFLVTALNVPTRKLVKTEFAGDSALVKLLHDVCTRSEQGPKERSIEVERVTLACEVLKALFNLYINADDAVEDQEKGKTLVSILYKLLTFDCSEKRDELQSNIVNLLTVIPFDCCESIVPAPSKNSKVIFQNTDMTAISILLGFLDRRLNYKQDLIGNLSPVVSAFIRLVKADKRIRRFVRLQVLPPLKDVMNRPEEGTTLRAKLCKLLTCPLTELRDLVAEFLFILCKENVARMIKYTGYGNAAGMFANKGLLGTTTETATSSESEESDTEEYQKHKEQINPVTGCFEPPKKNPLEGMSEEQKEYEAMQLVGLVDKLTRGGVVQPCRLGEDGKPKPIQHVLELQEELPKQQLHRQGSDSD